MEALIGSGQPLFLLRHPQGSGSQILLPYTGDQGLVETNDEDSIKHTLDNGRISKIIHGYRKHFTLYYDTYSDSKTGIKLLEILRAEKTGFDIYLIPRIDNPLYMFKVIYSGDSFDLGVLKGGVNSIGNRLITLKWTTKELIPDLGWIDVSSLQTYFFDNIITI